MPRAAPTPLDAKPDAKEKGGRAIRSGTYEVSGVETDDFFYSPHPFVGPPELDAGIHIQSASPVSPEIPLAKHEVERCRRRSADLLQTGLAPRLSHLVQNRVEKNRNELEMACVKRREPRLLRIAHRRVVMGDSSGGRTLLGIFIAIAEHEVACFMHPHA